MQRENLALSTSNFTALNYSSSSRVGTGLAAEGIIRLEGNGAC